MRQEKELTLTHNGKKMPIFTCSCGKQILILPDLKQMNKAIRAHLKEHKKSTGQDITEDEMADNILASLSDTFF